MAWGSFTSIPVRNKVDSLAPAYTDVKNNEILSTKCVMSIQNATLDIFGVSYARLVYFCSTLRTWLKGRSSVLPPRGFLFRVPWPVWFPRRFVSGPFSNIVGLIFSTPFLLFLVAVLGHQHQNNSMWCPLVAFCC